MKELRFAVFGAGFWARYQLAAWQELPGVRCVAVCDPVLSKAEALAQRFSLEHVYAVPETLLANERLDFVDVISGVEAHRRLVELAAERGLHAVCQKPLAPTLTDAEAMVAACRRAGTLLLVHENWRWQTPLRELKRVLDSGVLGRPFRAHLLYANSFPVFDNQPFLKELDQFILSDMGTHLLDVVRFLFGEARTLCCQLDRVHADIRGEDVATVLLRMAAGTSVVCALSYASRLEHDRFPETFVLVEAERGSVELGPDYWLRTTTAQGTLSRRCPPPRYSWADPRYDLVQASMVPCLANLAQALRGEAPAETDAADNLQTLRLVFAAYDSARTGQRIDLQPLQTP